MRHGGTVQARGAASGLAAALLFGASTPAAKALTPHAGPLALAGLLYAGAGLGLALVGVVRRSSEAPLRRSDAASLLVMVVAGGVVAPALLVAGLARISATSGSLLLGLETPLTILLAVAAFREHVGWRELGGSAAVVAAGAVLASGPRGGGELVGALAIVGACALWALDNNVSQRLSLRDPVAVARWKSLAAGATSLALAALVREPLPALRASAAALATGCLGYGLSLVLYLVASRHLGAARQAALFATAPFFGAAVAVVALGEAPTARHGIAAVLVAAGLWAVIRARHGHLHAHAAFEHEHAHEHDEHHAHEHGELVRGPHSHRHVHAPLVHDHAHASDAHHRHEH
jgi:drug/metabolite transporter (DMT)-like permease